MFTVFVQATDGKFYAHGPARSSEGQAKNVARLLANRLGWVAVAAESAPRTAPAPKGCPSPTLAALSPVWKDPGLAAKWEAGKGRRVAAPAPAPKAKRERKAQPEVAAPAEVAAE